MLRRIRAALALLLIGAGLITVAAAPTATAIDLWDACSGANADTAVCKSKGDNVDNLVKNITSLLLWAIGAVSVIMIVLGGFKYVTSNGDANSIQSAKNTILYAVIGLAVAMLGQVIVQFVIKWV